MLRDEPCERESRDELCAQERRDELCALECRDQLFARQNRDEPLHGKVTRCHATSHKFTLY